MKKTLLLLIIALGIFIIFYYTESKKEVGTNSQTTSETSVEEKTDETAPQANEVSMETETSDETASQSKHLSFKGVQINGKLASYVAKMKQAGFRHVRSENNCEILEGEFAGYNECVIIVYTLETTDIVNTIGVIFPDRDNWSSLESDYKKLKSMLTEKYGTPNKCVEKIQGYADDNSSKYLYLTMDRCTYYTIFTTPHGNIELSIENENSKCYVRLQYWDKTNTSKVNSKAMDDL